MNKKIILTLVLLIFAQQEFYGMELDKNNLNKKKKGIWESIHGWVNCDSTNRKSPWPKLWLLWSILDNIPIQCGKSKIWKHGEAYYGLSNGIGLFPSILNFGWLKIGIVDVHFNIINLILDYFKCFVAYKTSKELSALLFDPFLVDLLCGIHIISIKILNCTKIKLIAPFVILLEKMGLAVGTKNNKRSTAWYIKFDSRYKMSWWYAFWSPRIEINIAELINYFKNL